jgi:hypothetical protein
VISFLGIQCHFQQYIGYNLQHVSQFYWCLVALSTGMKCRVYRDRQDVRADDPITEKGILYIRLRPFIY